MLLLCALAAAAPALLEAGGGRYQLDDHAAWPAAALIDASGAVRGVLHLSEERSASYPRLDVFDGSGRRRIIVRREGPLPIIVFLDAQERPRLQLLPSRAKLLDASGKPVAVAEAGARELLTVFAGGRQVAAAEQDEEGASVQLGSEGQPVAWLGVSESGWKLSVGGGRLVLLDTRHRPEPAERRPSIGPLYGLGPPARSRYTFAGARGAPRSVPVLPWEGAPLEFDDAGPTTGLAVPGERGPVLRLENAR